MTAETATASIALLDEVWASLSALGRELTDEDWDRVTDCPGWTVKDQYSHMIGSEKMLFLDEQPPETTADPDASHVKNPIGEANEKWIRAFAETPGQKVLAMFDATAARRLADLRAMPAEAWTEETWTPEGQGTYADFMSIRIFDCWTHEQDIRRAVGRQGHLSGPVVDHSMARMANALGYMVGKKAGAPAGSTVAFDVSGGSPLHTAVVVAEVNGKVRANRTDDIPDNPTVTLHLDTEAFAALACGRWSGERAVADGRVAFSGDAVLGAQVAGGLGYTI